MHTKGTIGGLETTKLHSNAEFVNDTAVIFYVGLVTRVVWCHYDLSGNITTEAVKKSD